MSLNNYCVMLPSRRRSWYEASRQNRISIWTRYARSFVPQDDRNEYTVSFYCQIENWKFFRN